MTAKNYPEEIGPSTSLKVNPEYPRRIEKIFNLKLNRNQTLQIRRLIYEIKKTRKIDFNKIVQLLKRDLEGKDPQGKDKFRHIKNTLVSIRYPLTTPKINIDTRTIFLNELKLPDKKTYHPKKEFIPGKVIVEKEARNSYLLNNIRKNFKHSKIEYIDYASAFLKKFKLTPYNLKEPLLFIVKERWDFIKKCPCTKNHIGCGYWIFNLGFGCPFDCSYCYLQQYQNFPGIILPSNLEDFFTKFDTFFRKINKPVRIGSGEFCDSLALDHLTGYSSKLIDFFSGKKVLFELKTKSSQIENILNKEPAKNIIISWSLNPQSLIDSEEYAVSSLKERLKAAQRIEEKGFKVAFHFDPIIYSDGWKKEYKKLVELLYHKAKPPFAWISLGTLRFNRQLKPLMEKRFPKNEIVYGELFIGEDKKLRYPEFLRIEIYQNMVKWIREFDAKTPVYLCMESKKVWKDSLFEVNSAGQVEDLLIANNV
ncbi:MAG: hypothetical protein JW734_07380 [Candidatus Omnitrophica bacterium]|nr:hypothetical protein [Candidatus Omnitrophota bacterium]